METKVNKIRSKLFSVYTQKILLKLFNDFVCMCVNFLLGFDEDDMEKPKFNFSAPSEKVPFCLDDNVQVSITDFFIFSMDWRGMFKMHSVKFGVLRS